jgi:hypothetical protein
VAMAKSESVSVTQLSQLSARHTRKKKPARANLLSTISFCDDDMVFVYLRDCVCLRMLDKMQHIIHPTRYCLQAHAYHAVSFFFLIFFCKTLISAILTSFKNEKKIVLSKLLPAPTKNSTLNTFLYHFFIIIIIIIIINSQ